MTVATYDPSEVDLYLAILHQVVGFSPDTIINITKDEDYFKAQKGGTGQVERLLVPDRTYTLQISLSQTSPSNSILNALATLDSLTGSGAFPIYAKDSSGDSLFLAATCWIESPPEASYRKDIQERVWTIKCTEMTFGLAGNGDSNIISQIANLGAILGQVGGNLGIY